MDNMTKLQRSKTMSKIGAKNTRPECKLRTSLFKLGYRYRKNVGGLPGKPDIVLVKLKSVIFVNGCFWHHHDGCNKAAMPKSNIAYWKTKLHGNVERDMANSAMLVAMGWKVLVIWECEINYDFSSALSKAIDFLSQPA